MTTPLPTPPPLELVLAQIRVDADAGRFAHWGTSTLIDEFTGVPSISRELFTVLHTAAGITATFPIGNAGVIHVYGYWFSQVPTPFGFKRDRWADGVLARALGCLPDAFHLRQDTRGPATSPSPSTTALSRVTAATYPLLLAPPVGSLHADAEIHGSGGQRSSRVVLLPPGPELPGGATALIYGIAAAPSAPAPTDPAQTDQPHSTPFQLITTFPVSGDPASLLHEFTAFPCQRWNAVIS